MACSNSQFEFSTNPRARGAQPDEVVGGELSGAGQACFFKTPVVQLERCTAPIDSEASESASIRDGNITGSEEDSTLTDRSAALDQSKRKRYRKQKADGESSSETPSGKVARKRNPKAPKEAKSACETTPSTSHYAGVGEAQQKLSALKRQQKEKELEERAAAYEQKSREAKRKHGYGTPLLGNKTVPELQQVVLDETWAIANDASRCSNMKGTIQKAFKERAANLRSVMEELLKRSLSEETLRMQATIDRLSAEVAQLRSERSLVRCKCTGSTFATVAAVAPASAPATAPPTVPSTPAPAPSQDSEPMDVVPHAPQITTSDFQEALRQFGLEQKNFVRAVNKPPVVEPPKPSKGKGKGKKTKAPANASVAAPSDPEPRAGPSGDKEGQDCGPKGQAVFDSPQNCGGHSDHLSGGRKTGGDLSVRARKGTGDGGPC
ncbi:hypothetical protein ABMA28_017261 [Loxostege sticticalis]|uniref:Uncharacterized protein n=1 Tax=Loxostege sticticalis TaxID=481309 RepID=A0ABD0S1Y5_LOXSC